LGIVRQLSSFAIYEEEEEKREKKKLNTNLCTFKKSYLMTAKEVKKVTKNKIQRTRWKRSHSWLGKIVIIF
jgi:hypothetical protein